MLRRIRLAQTLMDQACEKLNRDINIVGLCGSHTVSILRNAIPSSVPEKLKLLPGLGCSACLASDGYIDTVRKLAEKSDTIICCKKDLLRILGLTNKENSEPITNVMEALDVAQLYPEKNIVYAAIGFETCVPAIGVALEQAKLQGIENLTILSGLKKVTAGVRAILQEPDCKVDAFICCGIMSAITGIDIYDGIMQEFNKPCVSIGLEPMQLIEGIAEICRQLIENKPQHTTEFAASLTHNGNPNAWKYINDYFDIESAAWRGLGFIENSSYVLKDAYREFDALKKFDLQICEPEKSSAGKCDEVMTRKITPDLCPLYCQQCNPDAPKGPGMASSEGACFAWKRYVRRKKS